ncbi:xanthine dehydrogenase accessory factor [Halopseudomonas xinjiangensis]|uniref:Xanthine dehydrogenase accessory factor n=1 Tax=Halopseudomonas xinjiangensis TaxID=487184 RepID=A0A1H1R4E6_9GAMM|nr:XdhC family protein [Halopseudomonas xinjiangensis]SDS30674.1 xanthine dehydrogenase accessory factor [Halopseudomonas xinjiangensis]
MDNVDLAVLRSARDWMHQGHPVVLYTVIETWGSAPRPVGSLLALRSDGRVEGSVSGGCIEDDLLRSAEHAQSGCKIISYGVSQEESARFGLPCGGTVRLLCESLGDSRWVEDVVARCEQHERVIRQVDIATGQVSLVSARGGEKLRFDGTTLYAPYGPAWRLMLVGAGQLSRYVAELAGALGFEVFVCDPRPGYEHDWAAAGVRFIGGMPDDAVAQLGLDAHTAVVALTHDPVLDDLALLQALRSDALYVGALGSRRNNERRRTRLIELGLTEAEVKRLHGPIGLPIGSRTPPEIALSLMAEVVAIRNGAQQQSPGALRCA